MDEAITPTQAQLALHDAEAARTGMAHRGRWLAGYFAAFSVGTAVVVAVIGLGGTTGVTFATIGWVLLVSLGVSYAARRGVRTRGDTVLHASAWGGFAVVYAAVIIVGHRFPGEPAYWLPGAVLAAAPTAVAALVALRRSRA